MTPRQADPQKPRFSRKRSLFLGRDSDSLIKSFFGSNAMVAIVVLALITIFLFKEGAGFVGMYHKSLQKYRLSGLEYVDLLKDKREAYTTLTRYLSDIRGEWIDDLKAEGLSQSEIAKTINAPEARDVFLGYMRVGGDLRKFVKEKMDAAIATRDQFETNQNLRETVENYEERIVRVENPKGKITPEDRASFALQLIDYAGKSSLAPAEAERYRTLAASMRSDGTMTPEDRTLFSSFLKKEMAETEAMIVPVDFARAIAEVTGEQERLGEIMAKMDSDISEILAKTDALDLGSRALEKRIEHFKELNRIYIASIPEQLEKLAEWDQTKPVPLTQAIVSFITGKDWITASDQQDWYGLLPLLTGSLLISMIALFFAVPFGVGAAIYVNQIAGSKERNFIKPYIEFVSAIPSVVIGFFGVVVFGEAIRLLSQQDFMAWVPFFPVQERLNAFTAGCLLALMAIPTIFTLAEDAINNIPRHFKEASLAMGATSLQTTVRIIVPTALSGIISAIMLGFGRVIGETMVVLLCAGNRIKIPDFTEGLGVFFDPVHTMTGIIAQEMGEVVQGSLHYRALFMVGIVLFFLSLLINFSAQWVVRRFSKLGD